MILPLLLFRCFLLDFQSKISLVVVRLYIFSFCELSLGIVLFLCFLVRFCLVFLVCARLLYVFAVLDFLLMCLCEALLGKLPLPHPMQLAYALDF